MSREMRWFHIVTVAAGVLSCVWIGFDFFEISSDLHAVLFGDSGWIIGIGYLFILIFHLFMIIIILRDLRQYGAEGPRVLLIFLLIASFLALAAEKVMYDEVAREYYLEPPAPGEVGFIYLGLAVNALFILYALLYIVRSDKRVQV